MCFAVGFGAPAPLPLQGLRPLEGVWLKDPSFRIEWKDGWEATYAANKERWQKEIERRVRDRSLRKEYASVRLIRLLHELLERYPTDAEKRIAAYTEIADHLTSLGCRGRANYCLKKLVEEFPGRLDLTARALDRILAGTRQRPADVEEGEQWVEYAASRLIALSRAGHLPDEEFPGRLQLTAGALHRIVARGRQRPGEVQSVGLAWHARLSLAFERGRLWQAAQALEALEAMAGPEGRWRPQRAELLLAAGRRQEARRLLDELAAQEGGRSVSGRLRQLSRESTSGPPDFATRSALELRWDALRARAVAGNTKILQGLLEESAKVGNLVPWGKGRHTSLWAAIDRYLLKLKPEALAPLRDLQQREARRQAMSLPRPRVSRASLPASERTWRHVPRWRASSGAEAPQALFAAYRRYPWAGEVHKALVELGTRALREGHSGLALRAFQDVVSHASDPALRSKAQAGLWLATRNEARDAKAIEAAFRGVPEAALFPWMGERKSAAFIKDRLLAGLGRPERETTAARPLSRLVRHALSIPPVSPWVFGRFRRVREEVLGAFRSPSGQLQPKGGKVFISGPNLLACFRGDLRKPLWWRTPGGATTSLRREGRAQPYLTVPGSFLPAIAGGRIYSRWGMDSSCQYMTGIAAFGAETGQMLWSTDRDPAWGEALSISDPTVADGRVYALAVRRTATSVSPVWLMCLDAEAGTLLWQALLASQNLGLFVAEGAWRRHANQIDLAHYGNPVTVHEGAVYCVTNAGFVARCDARDGLVEWAYTYPRARLSHNLLDAIRRQGAAPIVAGDAVVFLPRDHAGVFALDRTTGELLWETPFVPSHEAVGLVGRTLLLSDARHLLALDTASGRALWHRRFPGAIQCRPALAGSVAYVATRRKLYRLAAKNGWTIEERDQEGREPIRDWVVRGSSLIAITGRSVGERPRRFLPGPGAPSARVPPGLARAWQLPRRDPRLWLPPAEAKVSAKLYLFSEGVLACVRTSREGGIEWQRILRPGFVGVTWAENTMLFIYRARILALDASSGAIRWEVETPFEVHEWGICGDHLVVGRLRHPGPHAGVIRLSTGEVLWHRRFLALQSRRRSSFVRFACDGKSVHLIASRFRHGGKDIAADLVVRPSDGRVVAVRPFPREGEPLPSKLIFGKDYAFLVSRDKAVFECALSDGGMRRYEADLTDLDPRQIEQFELSGPWLQILWRRGYAALPDKHWVLRRGQPSYLLRRKDWGVIRGDRLYEAPDRSRTLAAVDLHTKKEARYEIPYVPHGGRFTRIVDFHESGDKVWVFSTGHFGDRPASLRLRVDAFDRASRAHLNAQVLPDIVAQRPQVAWTDGAVFVAGLNGLHCLVPAPPGDTGQEPVHVAHRVAQPVTLDGSLDEWDERGVIRLKGEDGARGKLHVAHDAANLYLAVSRRDTDAVPRVGRRDCGGGDSLELRLATNKGAFRWGVGVDPRGRVVWETYGSAGAPEGIRANVKHDLAGQELTYELAIPLKSAAALAYPWRRIRLSVGVWDDQPSRGGASRVLTWGEALVGEHVLPAARETVFLHPMTREQAAAASALVHQLPELPISFELFEQDCKLRTTSADALAELYWGFIQRHPRSAAAEGLLLVIERTLRASGKDVPARRIVERATRAGVPASVRRRYERQSKAYLSQWVHVAPGTLPRSVMVELNSGMGADEWAHRAYWGEPVRAWFFPARRMGAREALPQGEWHELRIPLHFIDMHDQPICGINFCQQGGPRVVWDRTALVYDGKEKVLLDDELPKGRTHWTWEWVDEPARSGAKAHASPVPRGWHDVSSHAILELDTPITHHVVPPLHRPYLSQWVFLDPAHPPKGLLIGLHDGRGWRWRLLWGKRTCRGRYMGPLPGPGRWRELRIPLPWTPFLNRPIFGIAFGHDGGRVVWDRTAVVANAQEHVIIEDESPAIRVKPRRREWHCWVDNHAGVTRPVPGRRGVGLECDGRSGYVQVPHSPALEPARLSLEAWVYLRAYPPGRDDRRWIVNKNSHEHADGHYALMVRRGRAGAYLNIGGGAENCCDAWSPEGSLRLNRWHHLAMTYDGSVLRFYLNGEEAASTVVNKRRVPGTTPLHIGRRQAGYAYFGGIIDEVRLYNRALSPEEVRRRYRAEGAPPAKDTDRAVAEALVGHWGFDDQAAPVDPRGQWQWVDKPVRSGRRAHTQAPAAGPTAHFVRPLKAPIVEHLPFEGERAFAALKEHIPRLGPTSQAWRYFENLVALAPTDAPQQIELRKWFLRQFPDHPRAVDILGTLLELHTETDDPDPVASVETFVREREFPLKTLYWYHREYAYPDRSFLRAWQVLGPFPDPDGSGFEARYPPETDGVRLGQAYRGAAGEVRWTLQDADTAFVDLDRLLEPNEHVVAYAACWIHSDRERPAVVAFGSDDACKIWLNGRLVLARNVEREARQADDIFRVRLVAGWNEVLVKVTEKMFFWGFYFELLDGLARKAPEGIRLSATGRD